MRHTRAHLISAKLLFATLLAWTSLSIAAAENVQNFTIDGQLFSDTASTTPLASDPGVTFKIQILDPSKNCVLYEEQQVRPTNASGAFSIQVGSPTGNVKRTTGPTGDPGHSMARVFTNDGTVVTAANTGTCAAGFTAAAGSSRYLRITVTPTAGTPDTFANDMLIDSVPSAWVAEELQGVDKSKILLANTTAPTNLSQTVLETLFTTTNISKLNDLLAGTSTQYLAVPSGGAPDLPSFAGTTPTGASAGTIWWDTTGGGRLMYYNGTSSVAIGTAGAAGLTSISVTSDLTAAGVVGGTLSANGTIGLGTVSVAHGGTGVSSLSPNGILTANIAGDGVTSMVCSLGDVLKWNGTSWACNNLTQLGTFANGGNTWGAASSLGNKDGFALSLKTNDVARLTIDAGGSVGVGTSSPVVGAITEFKGTGITGSSILLPRDSTANRPTTGVNGMIRYNASTNKIEAFENGAWTSYATAAGSSQWGNAGANLYYSSGNVSIGTTGAGAPFDVMDSGSPGISNEIATFRSSNGGLRVGIYDENVGASQPGGIGNSSGYGLGLYAVTGSQGIRLFTSNNERVRVDQYGNVGVGTVAPVALADFYGVGTASAILLPRETTSNRPGTGVNGMIRYNSTTNKLEAFENGAWTSYAAGAGSSQWTTAGSDIYYTTGKVGIGTTTPASPLSIEQTSTVSASGASSGSSIQITIAPGAAQNTSNWPNGTRTFGGDFYTKVDASNTQTVGQMYGSYSRSENFGTGTLSQVVGSRSWGYNGGAANITNVVGSTATSESDAGTVYMLNGSGVWTAQYGGATTKHKGYAADVIAGGGTSAEMTGLELNMSVAGGTVTTQYGIKIDSTVSSGSISGDRYGIYLTGTGTPGNNNYGIYQAASAQTNFFSGTVGLGTNAVATGAAVEIRGLGTSRSSLLLPRDTTNLRPLSAVNGMIRYNSTTNKLEAFENGAWTSYAAGAGSSQWTTAGSDIYYTTGKVGIGSTTPTSLLDLATSSAGFASSVKLLNTNYNIGLSLDSVWPGINFNTVHNGTNKVAIGTYYGGTLNLDPNTGDIHFNTTGNPGDGATVTETKLMSIRQTGVVGIGTTTPTTGALVEMRGLGTTKSSLLLPRDSTVLRPLTGVNGMIRYNTTTNKFEAYENGAWTSYASSAGSSQWTTTGSDIYYSTGKVGIGTNSPGTQFHLATGQMTIPAGSSGSPSLLFAGSDLGAGPGGLYWVGGTTRVVGDTSTSLAVGNASANLMGGANSNFKLNGRSVAQEVSSTVAQIAADYTDLYLDPTNASGRILFFGANDGTKTKMVVQASGAVGIGTTVPVTGALTEFNGLGTTQSSVLLPRDTTNSRPLTGVNGMVRYNSTTNKIEAFENGAWTSYAASGSTSQWTTNGSDIYYSAGKVGVGTTAPTNLIEAKGATNTSGIRVIDNDSIGSITLRDGGTTANEFSALIEGAPYGANRAMIIDSVIDPSHDTAGIGGIILRHRTTSGAVTGRYPLIVRNDTTNLMALNATGDLGMGRNPTSMLDLYRAGSTGNVTISNIGASGYDPFPTINMQSFLNGQTAGNPQIRLTSYGGASGAYTALPPNQLTGAVYFRANTTAGATTNSTGVAGIEAYTGPNFSDTDREGVLVFSTGDGSAAPPPERMRLDYLGNLGIGTNAPKAQLDLFGTGTASSAMILPRDSVGQRPTGINGMLRYNTTSNAFEGYANGAWGVLGGGGASQWTTAGSDIYYSTGKVGIGTASSNQVLDVYKSGGAPAMVFRSNQFSQPVSFAAPADTGFYLGTGSTGSAVMYGMSANASTPAFNVWGFIGSSSPTAGNPVFKYTAMKDNGGGAQNLANSDTMLQYKNGGAASAVLTLQASGALGINTNTPAATLDLSQTTDAAILPVGSSGARPTGVNGMIRYNSTLNSIEAYVSGAWQSLTGGGSTGSPTAFGFTDQTGAAISTLTTSNTVTLAGSFSGATASCVGCVAIAKNGVWGGTTATGLTNGDTIAIRLYSAPVSSTVATATVTIGATISSTWSVTTGSSGPTSFSFTDQSNVNAGQTIDSNIVTLSAFAGSATATCGGDCIGIARNGTWGSTTVSGFVGGDTIQLRVVSNTSSSGTKTATLTVGTTTVTPWTVTTVANTCGVPLVVGAVCTDGTVYGGLSPDGNVPMYFTRCDAGQTWNGSACTGTRTQMTWNNGGAGAPQNVDMGYHSWDTGAANTVGILAAVNLGAPYNAVAYCDGLNLHGHTDWYLPAGNELEPFYYTAAAIGGFELTPNYDAASTYWTSSEWDAGGAVGVYAYGWNGQPDWDSWSKRDALLVRCVRK